VTGVECPGPAGPECAFGDPVVKTFLTKAECNNKNIEYTHEEGCEALIGATYLKGFRNGYFIAALGSNNRILTICLPI